MKRKMMGNYENTKTFRHGRFISKAIVTCVVIQATLTIDSQPICSAIWNSMTCVDRNLSH